VSLYALDVRGPMKFRISHIAQGLDGLPGQPHHGKRLLIAPGALNRLGFIKPPAEAVLELLADAAARARCGPYPRGKNPFLIRIFTLGRPALGRPASMLNRYGATTLPAM
jgi:hypothetical protein